MQDYHKYRIKISLSYYIFSINKSYGLKVKQIAHEID